jgi:hypothetical protein
MYVQDASNLYVVCAITKGLASPASYFVCARGVFCTFYIFFAGLECVDHSFAYVAPL